MTGPPTDYHVHGEVVSGGRAAVTAGNRAIPVDAAWAETDLPGEPGPAELLAGAFAACLIKNLERSAALLSFRYECASVDVRARRQDVPPRFVEIEYELRLVTDERPAAVRSAHAATGSGLPVRVCSRPRTTTGWTCRSSSGVPRPQDTTSPTRLPGTPQSTVRASTGQL